MRWVAQNLPTILISCPLRELAGVNILYKYRAASPAHPRHFAQYQQWFLKMMQRQPAHGYVKRAIFKRKILRVSGAKRNIFDAPRRSSLFGDSQHRICQIDAHDIMRGPGESFRDVPRPRRDVQHAFGSGKPSSRN